MVLQIFEFPVAGPAQVTIPFLLPQFMDLPQMVPFHFECVESLRTNRTQRFCALHVMHPDVSPV